MKKEAINCVRFICDDNLSQYVDSMLFDSGTCIASGDFEKNGKTLKIDLIVTGSVSVTYNGEVYHTPSEFPYDLRVLILNNRNWDMLEQISVTLNNWFEYLFEGNGILEECDISQMTAEEIKSVMSDIAEEYI